MPPKKGAKKNAKKRTGLRRSAHKTQPLQESSSPAGPSESILQPSQLPSQETDRSLSIVPKDGNGEQAVSSPDNDDPALFPQFRDFPVEIRLRVFRLARQPRILEVKTGTHDFDPAITPGYTLPIPSGPLAHLIVGEKGPNRLPLANQESLSELNRTGTVLIPRRDWLSTPFFYNDKLDTLYITSEGQTGFSPHAWHNLIVHLASHGQPALDLSIDLELLDQHHPSNPWSSNLPRAGTWVPRAFAKVEEVTIIIAKHRSPTSSWPICLCESSKLLNAPFAAPLDAGMTRMYNLRKEAKQEIMEYFRTRMMRFSKLQDAEWKCFCDGGELRDPVFRHAIWEGAEGCSSPTDYVWNCLHEEERVRF